MAILPNLVIFSMQLSQLAKIDSRFTTELFTKIITAVPSIGKDTENYWLINNTLTLNNPNNIAEIHLFNIFVQVSRQKCNLIQIIKNT